MDVLFWGAALRILQALFAAAPTMLIGAFVAAIVHRLLGYERTRKLFGHGTWRELPQAWLLGMLLPVCSLGVIPVASRLRSAGLRGGTLLAFAIAAPLFNPLSLLYGLTLSEPLVILAFAQFSLVVVSVVGWGWDRLCPGSGVESAEPPLVPHGWRRMAAVATSSLRIAGGSSLVWLAIAMAGVALLAVLLPAGSLQTSIEHNNIWAPMFMALVAIPAYLTPLGAMWQLGSIFQHGNSVGAGFSLLVLGAGVNLGLLGWMVAAYGWRRGLLWLGMLLAVTVALAYTGNDLLHPSDVQAAGHTHAFDGYCCPFHADTGDAFARFRTELDSFSRHEWTLLGVFGAVALVGLLLNILDPRERIEAFLERAPTAAPSKRQFDVEVRPAVIGGVALVGVVAFSIVGCYAYYPSPKECFGELQILRAELLSSAIQLDAKSVEHYKPLMDDWTRRLQAGLFLRTGQVSPYQRMKARVLRNKLELLEHAVADRDAQEAHDYAMASDRAYRRLRAAFLPNSAAGATSLP